MLSIDFILGTRPEITKCGALILALVQDSEISVEVGITGQQTNIVSVSLDDLGIQKQCPVHWLTTPGNKSYISNWYELAADALRKRWQRQGSNAVIIQGDTSSARLG